MTIEDIERLADEGFTSGRFRPIAGVYHDPQSGCCCGAVCAFLEAGNPQPAVDEDVYWDAALDDWVVANGLSVWVVRGLCNGFDGLTPGTPVGDVDSRRDYRLGYETGLRLRHKHLSPDEE